MRHTCCTIYTRAEPYARSIRPPRGKGTSDPHNQWINGAHPGSTDARAGRPRTPHRTQQHTTRLTRHSDTFRNRRAHWRVYRLPTHAYATTRQLRGKGHTRHKTRQQHNKRERSGLRLGGGVASRKSMPCTSLRCLPCPLPRSMRTACIDMRGARLASTLKPQSCSHPDQT